jgi:hypothetical protein
VFAADNTDAIHVHSISIVGHISNKLVKGHKISARRCNAQGEGVGGGEKE